VHAAVDRKGRPIRVRLTPGNEADVTQAGALLFGLRPKAVIADKTYDFDGLVGSIRRRKGRAVIPPKSNRVRFRWYDRTLYRERNKIERFFNRLKDFRCCATRFDKLDVSFLGMIYLACAVIWMGKTICWTDPRGFRPPSKQIDGFVTA
jgi:transposase